MAEEEKKEEQGLQTEENTGEADSKTTETLESSTAKEETEKETVNYEKRYKDLQAENTRTSQRLAELEAEKRQREEETGEEDIDSLEDEGFVDGQTVKKMVNDAVSKAISTVKMQAADRYFRKTYPNLVKHQSAISGIMRSPKDPAKLVGVSPEERIDAAVAEFNSMNEEMKKEAEEAATEAAKLKADQNRKATGLGSSITSPPAGEDEEGESDADHIAARKARSAKRRGLS